MKIDALHTRGAEDGDAVSHPKVVIIGVKKAIRAVRRQII